MHAGPALRAHGARTTRPGRLALCAVALLAALAILLAAGCGDASTSGVAESTELTVFAAASLTDAFAELGDDFTATHPGTKSTFQFRR